MWNHSFKSLILASHFKRHRDESNSYTSYVQYLWTTCTTFSPAQVPNPITLYQYQHQYHASINHIQCTFLSSISPRRWLHTRPGFMELSPTWIPRDQYLHRKQAAQRPNSRSRRGTFTSSCTNCKLWPPADVKLWCKTCVYHCKRRRLRVNQSLCLRSRRAFVARCVLAALSRCCTAAMTKYHECYTLLHHAWYTQNTMNEVKIPNILPQ